MQDMDDIVQYPLKVPKTLWIRFKNKIRAIPIDEKARESKSPNINDYLNLMIKKEADGK